MRVLIKLWLAVLAAGAGSQMPVDAAIRWVTTLVVIVLVVGGVPARRRPVSPPCM